MISVQKERVSELWTRRLEGLREMSRRVGSRLELAARRPVSEGVPHVDPAEASQGNRKVTSRRGPRRVLG